MTAVALPPGPSGDLRPGGNWLARMLGIAVVLSGLGAGWTVVPDRSMVVKVAGLLVGAIAVGLLIYRNFAGFVMLALATRSAADYVHAGTVVGAGFVGASGVWLLIRWHAGRMHSLSKAARALLFVTFGAVIGSLGAVDPAYSVNAAAKLLSVALVFITVETLVVDRPELRIRFVATALVAGIAPFSLALIQLALGQGGRSDVEVSRVQGTFNHPNVLAMFGAIQLLLAVALWPHVNSRLRRVLVVSGALSSIAVLFSYARAAWIGVVVAGLVLLFRYSRRAGWTAIAVLALLVLTVPSIQTRVADLNADKPTDPSFKGNANSFAWRLEYWRRIAPGFAQAPLTGLGLEATQRQNPVHLEPHNSYLQTVLEMGTLGAIGLVWVGIEFKRAALRSRDSNDPLLAGLSAGASATGLAIAVIAVTENVLTQPVILWYVVLPFALLRRSDPPLPSLALPVPTQSRMVPA